jgi:hypothetical protein
MLQRGHWFLPAVALSGLVLATSAAGGAALPPPTISHPPQSEVVTPGNTISLRVTATGAATLKYQWQLDGTNLAGQTAISLSILHATTNNAGTYTIVVTNPYSQATASAVVAVVPTPPVIVAPVNNFATAATNLTVRGREATNGEANAILFQFNQGATQAVTTTNHGLNWSAAVVLVPGTNTFSVWATNFSGASSVLTEHFILNPFLPLAGAYNGLFYNTNVPAFTNSGFLTLTLAASRTFSGRIQFGDGRIPFTGQFDTNGGAAVTASNSPSLVFALALQLDLTGATPLLGSVSNIVTGATSTLTAYQAGFSGTLPATNYAGNYVLAMNGSSAPAAAPSGYSFAQAIVGADGGVQIWCNLADGSSFSTSGVLGKDGDWPFYSPLYHGQGSVMASASFAGLNKSGGVLGQPCWFKSAGAAPWFFYTNGFALLPSQLSLTGNLYPAPHRGVAVLTNTNYTLQLFGGNLSTTVSDNISISHNNVVAFSANTNQLAITISAAQGLFFGSFIHPVTHQPTTVDGLILPGSDMAFGCFLGTNQGGGLLISPR